MVRARAAGRPERAVARSQVQQRRRRGDAASGAVDRERRGHPAAEAGSDLRRHLQPGRGRAGARVDGRAGLPARQLRRPRRRDGEHPRASARRWARRRRPSAWSPSMQRAARRSGGAPGRPAAAARAVVLRRLHRRARHHLRRHRAPRRRHQRGGRARHRQVPAPQRGAGAGLESRRAGRRLPARRSRTACGAGCCTGAGVGADHRGAPQPDRAASRRGGSSRCRSTSSTPSSSSPPASTPSRRAR